MSLAGLNSNDREKLKKVIDEGIKIMQETKDLRESLRDTVKAIAEDLGVEPKHINKAIRVAFKSSINSEKEDIDNIETILQITGNL